MRLKELESALHEISVFQTPIPELEQYPTSAHLAARVAHMMHATYDDVEEKLVCDLGSGTGMLSIAAAIMGAVHVTAFDIDSSALELAEANAHDMEVENIDFCQADITGEQFIAERCGRVFDTVIMNPPFGTKRKGVDIAFLQRAVQICSGAVYSMHKTSTRDYILRKSNSWGATGEVLAELKFDIGRMYRFHKSDSVDVQVDLWRFDVSKVPSGMVFAPIDLSEAGVVNTRRSRGVDQGKSALRGRGRGRMHPKHGKSRR